MKSKNFIFYLFIFLFALFLLANIAIELLYTDAPANRLSSSDYTDEVASKINRMSLIYEFLIIYLFFLLGYAFYSAFKLLMSPRVDGALYKVVICTLLYIASIAVAIRGYNSIIVIDSFMNLTGTISEHFYKTSWSHLIIICLIGFAKYIEFTITKDYEKNHEKTIMSTEKPNDFNKLKEIIKNGK